MVFNSAGEQLRRVDDIRWVPHQLLLSASGRVGLSQAEALRVSTREASTYYGVYH